MRTGLPSACPQEGGVLTLHPYPHSAPSALLDTIFFPSETTMVK